MRRYFVLILIAVAFATPVALFEIGGSSPASAAPNNNRVPGQYIVTLKPGEKPVSVANRFRAQGNVNIKHTYEHVLNGFSAKIPDKLVEKLRQDPAVLSIVEDQKISIASDSRPSGIRRSEADRNAISQIGSHTNPIAVDVAVIDTGIDGDHPDLNVVGGINCVAGETSWEDLHGHGTHVAGTIGALDNGSGVVGVAPGARLWAVRVLNADGDGEFSDAICGIDWITANAHILEVANMSLGGEGAAGSCSDGGFRQAICESVATGITYIAAAGNAGVNADTFVPASFPEVITVSALADTDGQPGGNGSSSIFYGADDTLATFSNFGQAVDIAAPGVNIQSTWPNGGYNSLSGTSMASPHVAGAAAIYLHQNPGASPTAVRSHILAEAWPQSSPQGFTGDVDSYPEPLLNAGTIGGLEPLPPPPPPELGCQLTADNGAVGSQTTINCTGLEAYEWVWVYWDSASDPARGLFIAATSGEGSFTLTIPDAVYGEHAIIAKAAGLEATLPFAVEPSLKIGAESGSSGSFVAMYARGFGAGDTIDFRWYSTPDTFVVLKSATASSTGRATIYTYVPDGAGGPYTVEAVSSGSGASGTGTYTIVPGLKLSPSSGRVGSTVTATASGFQDSEAIDLLLNGAPAATGIADGLGKATFQISMPEGPAGPSTFEAVGDAGSNASASYTITPSLALSASTGTVGADITFTLAGFAANETIRLDWSSSGVGTATLDTTVASELGSASHTIQIPEATSGYYSIKATGMTSGKSASAGISLRSSISIEPASGLHGETVVATLAGYKANETVNLKWYEQPYSGTMIATATSTALGSATITFQVPADTSYGDHKVESAAASGLGRASTIFTVESENGPVEATCTVDPGSGTPGTRVLVDCYGFQQGEFIRIYWDTTATYAISSIYAANGSGTTTITIPDGGAGSHSIIGIGSKSGSEAAAAFTVEPSIGMNKTSGTVGSWVYATLRGFGPNESITISWDDGAASTTIGNATASATGRASTSIYVPAAPSGTYSIRATGQSTGSVAATDFTIIPRVATSLTTGVVGSSLTVTVSGFVAGSAVEVGWDGAPVGSVTVSSSGGGSMTMSVPESSQGKHTISAADGQGATASTSFTVNPRMVLSDTNSTVGDEIFVDLTGFATGEQVEIRWYSTTTSYIVVATTSASAIGSGSASFIVPEDVYGFRSIKAFGTESQKTATVYFTLSASVSLSVSDGPTGTTVTATLHGFKKNETLTLHWFTSTYSSFQIATGTSDASGTGTIVFDVPADATPGGHKIEGRSSSGSPRSSTTFTVN